ncbi:MAG: helix-turn-helix domain-containing protein [Ginsengibacter sp.]
MKTKPRKIPTPTEVKYIQDTLYVVGGKWKLPILYCLSLGAFRFADLKQNIPKITSRMLSKELKELELNGFVKRDCCDDFNRYVITDYCKSFEKIIIELINWGKEHRRYLSLTV